MPMAKSTEFDVVPPAEEGKALVAAKPSLLDIIDRASKEKVDVATLAELWRMNLEWEANEARKAFVDAMNQFKAMKIQLPRNRHVKIVPKDQTKSGAEYWHITLDKAAEIIVPALNRVEISHRWEMEDTPEFIRCTCILTHRLGHCEKTTLGAPPDATGGKNAVQARASTVTYLQRYTLLAAVGLAAEDTDDDANGGGLSNDVIAEQCEYMANACNMAELKKLYGVAANMALDVADKRAIGIFKEAKAKKEQELA